VTRADVDRVRRISLRLGGTATPGAVSICDEVLRLRRLCSDAYDLLQQGDDSVALDLLLAEIDPSWGRSPDENPSPAADIPMDHGVPIVENKAPAGGAA
jgi:hypothetical protein